MPIASSPGQLVGYIECRLCGRCVVVDAAALPPAPLPPNYCDRLRCTRCGRRGVQAQLEAYNARDLNAFLAPYAEDAQLFEHPSKLLASGVAQLRERYAARFAEPNLHALVIKRIVMGNFVIDHERVTRTFPAGTGTLDAIAMYEVQGPRITRVWFIFGAPVLDPKP